MDPNLLNNDDDDDKSFEVPTLYSNVYFENNHGTSDLLNKTLRSKSFLLSTRAASTKRVILSNF